MCPSYKESRRIYLEWVCLPLLTVFPRYLLFPSLGDKTLEEKDFRLNQCSVGFLVFLHPYLQYSEF